MRQDIVIRRMGVKKDVSMDWFFDQPDVLTATRADFVKQFPKGTYAWLDKDKHRARFNPDRLNIKLRNEECGETIVSFKEDKISAVLISMLNKGDDGYIKEGPYKKAINLATGLLKAVSKVTEVPRKKNETISKADGLVWSTKKALYILEHLWVPEERRDGYIFYAHGEFVRIRILPPSQLMGAQQNTVKVNISRPSLVKNVKKEGGKVWIEGIPMVDQGSKGYCAVASFERVMRYYGSQVDMHDLADLANASGYFGTSPDGMKDAVHKMAVRTGLHSREPVFMEFKDYKSMNSAYNREAKKAGMGSVDLSESGIRGLYREMDPDLFKGMRAKESGFNKFCSEVAKSVNAGIPVMWALQLGMFWEERLEDSYEANRDKEDSDSDEEKPKDADKPKDGETPSDADKPRDEDKPKDKDKDKPKDEEKPKDKEKPKPEEKRQGRPPESMSGGHMRIILGYDPKARLIYYTDSWGPGHEMKKMTLEEAWSVTMALFIVEP
jgi:hypothetical protein